MIGREKELQQPYYTTVFEKKSFKPFQNINIFMISVILFEIKGLVFVNFDYWPILALKLKYT